MKFFSSKEKSGRSARPNHHFNLFPEGIQHPDLPLSPKPQQPSPRSDSNQSVNRSSSLSERHTAQSRDRRSLAYEPGYEPSLPYSPDDITQEQGYTTGGLARSQTVVRRDGARRADNPSAEPSPVLAPDWGRLPAPSEQLELQREEFAIDPPPPMNQFQQNVQGKTSSDSGQSTPALDRFTQRNLRRLNTEQGFRELRQGGPNVYSPPTSLSEQSGYHSSGISYPVQEPQYSQPQTQPHPSQQLAYQSDRSGPTNANSIQGQPISSTSRSNTNYTRQGEGSPSYTIPTNLQYSPTDPSLQNVQGQQHAAEAFRPGLPQQSRSYNSQQSAQSAQPDELSMSSNNGTLPAPKASRTGNSNRTSMHNGITSRDGTSIGGGQQSSGQQGVPAFNASVVPPTGQQQQAYQGSQPQQQSGAELGRKTPQPMQAGEEMTEDEKNQLIKDHKELREKYTKVKKYYFEKEDQVKQLQNSLAHQRLSQSRTSLDDSEYTTRFNRLDGLVAQLAFSIRKSWRSVPSWLVGSVNKDAIGIGKQEMTAAGRAFISCWLVEEVFNKYFHPDLDPTLSAQLKSIQRNIRHFAPPAQTAEEEEYLTSKVVNWRLSTLEGLHEALRSKECPANRAQLTDMLKEHLVSALAVHLQEPAPSDLEGGVHMIIELVVSIAIHLPLESRDVVIDYFLPGSSILHDQMKLETGIPPLTMSIAEDAAERTSVKSADSSEIADLGNTEDQPTSKKRSMLNALKGSKGGAGGDPRKHSGASGSSSSLNRPDSSQGMRQDQLPRVRMAAGIGVQIRGRSVLVKAPVFATS